MFPYFGGKGELIHHYPAPAYPRVMEPFAGSARYSLHHWKKEVWINDANPMIAEIWRYMQSASPQEIRALPDLRQGDDLRDFDLRPVEQDLLGFAIGPGTATPRFQQTSWGAQKQGIPRLKARILRWQHRIKDWRITCLPYQALPNEDATWFVDPPYQLMSTTRYPYKVHNYNRLGDWCRWRNGQVIVCEGRGADWLPFRHLTMAQNVSHNRYPEMVWIRED